jgi:hypothetical protein
MDDRRGYAIFRIPPAIAQTAEPLQANENTDGMATGTIRCHRPDRR